MIGVFEMFKISVGPSSSHTMGPWMAALTVRKFLEASASSSKASNNNVRVAKSGLQNLTGITVRLCGSLAKTGAGHYTPMGVLMGLVGETPQKVVVENITSIDREIKEKKQLTIGDHTIEFNPRNDILFDHKTKCAVHPNTLVFTLHYKKVVNNEENGKEGICDEIEFYSVGGGFIEQKGVPLFTKEESQHGQNNGEENNGGLKTLKEKDLPYPYTSALELSNYVKRSNGKTAGEIMLANELAVHSLSEVDEHINSVYDAMLESIFAGCHATGILPGGLNVMRRAPQMTRLLYRGGKYKNKEQWMQNIRESSVNNFDEISRWVICAALAVNEQNATCGKIVTAPTNGAAGVIPAVLFYYFMFHPAAEINFTEKKRDFFLVASMVGYLFKKNASISAAAAGCQGEIGVSSSMAAAALAYVKGMGIERAMMASEIAMEHHLGLTCDPIKGLVQVPCIERNTMGAMKAITASNLAGISDPDKAVVKLDDVIKTMWQTAKDMNGKYKETSEGGLAVNVSINFTEC